ncbi:MAG TPA: M56 family metallopeptidase, partial [Lacipirellula sp.]
MNMLISGDWINGWLAWIAAATWQLALLVAIVAAAAAVCGRASPRLRYALWLVVLVKVFLPTSLWMPWSIGAWGISPLRHEAQAAGLSIRVETLNSGAKENRAGAIADRTTSEVPNARGEKQQTPRGLTLQHLAIAAIAMWSVGCVLLLAIAVWRYGQLRRSTRRMELIDEGPARVELERLAMQLHERRVPDLYASEIATSPYLFGVMRPAIVAPREMLDKPEDRRAILLHELVHWRRRDPWVGWLQVVAQALFWFHPLVWVANARLRREREAACDEAVLRTGECPAQGYGETLLRILSAARGRSLVQGSMAGVFERGADLQHRLEAVMNYQSDRRRCGYVYAVVVGVFALLFLPMAEPPAAGAAEEAAAATSENASQTASSTASIPARDRALKGPPKFKSKPAFGETNVDPGLTEIVLTFDRNMEGGMSWTGGGEHFPTIDESREAKWRDKRTCVLPVRLKAGQFYRFGVNSTSFQNFRSERGMPALPAVVAFTTEGATPAVERSLRAPKVVEMEPENGAVAVDPATKALRVTFNMPMGEGFSWVGDAPTAEGQAARWSRDGRTCLLPVELQPGTEYELGLNSPSHINFTSRSGIPLKPVVYRFKTSGEATKTADRAPQIVKMVPANGAEDVSPGLKVLRVTFDRPMAGGFSWTGGGEHFPQIPEGKKPRWSR